MSTDAGDAAAPEDAATSTDGEGTSEADVEPTDMAAGKADTDADAATDTDGASEADPQITDGDG